MPSPMTTINSFRVKANYHRKIIAAGKIDVDQGRTPIEKG
jgi:hypothetical protein